MVPGTYPLISSLLTASGSGAAFFKMNGCGNNFLVMDARGDGESASGLAPIVKDVITSSEGVDFDQMLVLREGGEGVDAVMDMYNADGSSSEACGNGARCVALLLGESRIDARIVLQAGVRRFFCQIIGNERVRVDMGAPEWRPGAIPLFLPASVEDGSNLDPGLFPIPELHNVGVVGAVSMGNPHGVFFFKEATALNSIELKTIGPLLERDRAFPNRANISFAYIEARDSLRLRVWERGAGATLCCGTAACATHALARRHGLCDKESQVHLLGGTLDIYQRESDEHIFMSGHAAFEYGKKSEHENVVKPGGVAQSQAA